MREREWSVEESMNEGRRKGKLGCCVLKVFLSDDRSFAYQRSRPQLTRTTSRLLNTDDRSSENMTNDASFPLYPNDKSFDTHERHAV